MNKIIKTMEGISGKTMDYVFARDVSKSYDLSIAQFQEFNLNHSRETEDYYTAAHSSKAVGLFACSALPNLIHCMGIGASLYINNPAPLIAGSLTAEFARLFFRRDVRKVNQEHYGFVLFLANTEKRIFKALEEAI